MKQFLILGTDNYVNRDDVVCVGDSADNDRRNGYHTKITFRDDSVVGSCLTKDEVAAILNGLSKDKPFTNKQIKEIE